MTSLRFLGQRGAVQRRPGELRKFRGGPSRRGGGLGVGRLQGHQQGGGGFTGDPGMD
jgi:hypothetical protein